LTIFLSNSLRFFYKDYFFIFSLNSQQTIKNF